MKTWGVKWGPYRYEYQKDGIFSATSGNLYILTMKNVTKPPNIWYRFWQRWLIGMQWYKEGDHK